MKRRFPLAYPLWILVCAALFVLLAGAEDPSRRPDRIISNDAGRRAVALLRARGPAFRDYEAVHVAWADGKWVVLCDKVPHTGLREARVVEIGGEQGRLLSIKECRRQNAECRSEN